MTAKPSTLYTWATTTNYTTGPASGTPSKVAPSSGLQAEGWDPAVKPGAQHLNALLGNILTDWLAWLNTTPIFLGSQILTAASGTYTPTSGTRAVRVRMVGGGGGGGSAAANVAGKLAAGSGGSSGWYWEKWINPGALITGGAFVAGGGGAGGVGNGSASTAGSNGTDTTIVIQGVTYTAKGGAGGNFITGGGLITTSGTAPPGGTSAGDVTQADYGGGGIMLGDGTNWAAMGGAGGAGRMGTGGVATGSFGLTAGNGTNGAAGGTYGGAGAGAVAMCLTGGVYVNANGGAGAAGIIIVEEYG